jgi:3-oxoacyl-[acyl-carrier-protein] synthase-3
MSAAIVGTGACVPDHVVSNADLVSKYGIDTSDEWIVSRTGIRTRRWLRAEQATSDLAYEAARAALRNAGVSAREVGLVICATSSPDHSIPATASRVQHLLGAPAGAFDVNCVCSGFVHALVTGFALCERRGGHLILVIGADAYSRIIDVNDRRTAVFFGDGAGAVVLAPSPEPSWLRSWTWGCNGSDADKIIVPMGGSRAPVTSSGISAAQHKLRMDGRAVWDFATRWAPAAVREVVAGCDLEVNDLDWVIPHQANLRLLEHCAGDLGLPMAKMVTNVERYGNTAAASIPIALHEAVASGRIEPSHHIALVAFGSGLSWAAACLRWG